MFKNLLSAVGWGELPSSFGFSVGEKVDLPFSWQWTLHKGTQKSDGKAVSIFVCPKKELDSQQIAAAKNAVQMAKSLRHTHIIRALDSIEVEGGFYLVTEEVVSLLCPEATDADEKEPAVWGLYEVLDALAFLHQSGFTHGLFGPASVFVTKRGEYRLGGFELCRKGADPQAIIAQCRRCGPGVLRWPEPPAYLLDGGAPSIGVDLWGAAVMMLFVFGSVKSGARGADFRIDFSRATQDLPAVLHKPFAELSRPGPLRGRTPIASLCQLPFFQQHPAVHVMTFLGGLHIRSAEEKDKFFEKLPGLVDSLPRKLQTRQVLSELLEARKFPGQEGAQVLPSILKIGVRLDDDEFKRSVAPLVAQLFASPDRAVRFRLLTSIGDMIDLLDDGMINDNIFPECMNGFTDSSGPIREATVKSLIFFVPRLRAKIIEGKVVKPLVKLLQDPESSIRTNVVICCGRISGHLPKAVASQTLLSVLFAGFKDSFAPCRRASLQTLAACSSIFTVEDIATKLLPGVCWRLIDPDQSVADTAFSVLPALQQKVRQHMEEQWASAGKASEDAPAAQADCKETGGWSTWALSTVGSVVGDKIIGSIGRAKGEGCNDNAGTSVPAPPPPQQAPSGPQGTSLQPATAVDVPGGGVARSSSVADRTDAWGDDEDILPSDGAVGDQWGGDADFWNEFGDVPADVPKKDPEPAPSLPQRPERLERHTRAFGSAEVSKAKPLPKSTAVGRGSKDDDDFWKEFDM